MPIAICLGFLIALFDQVFNATSTTENHEVAGIKCLLLLTQGFPEEEIRVAVALTIFESEKKPVYQDIKIALTARNVMTGASRRSPVAFCRS